MGLTNEKKPLLLTQTRVFEIFARTIFFGKGGSQNPVFLFLNENKCLLNILYVMKRKKK